MNSTFTQLFSGGSSHPAAHLFILVPRMLAAVIIGTVLSVRPWRWLLGKARPKAEMVQAQVLLCAAAAVIIAVIGDSVAKAFGLVGLGGFVRFRSGLKDPRDAALLFLVIGLGMACGHGSLEVAFVGAAFVAVLLFVLDVLNREEKAPSSRMVVSAQADDLVGAEAALRRELTERNVVVKGCAFDFDRRRVELEVEESEPGGVQAALGRAHGAPVRGVRWMALPHKSVREEMT